MRIGLSSFTYTWAVGVPGDLPPRPLGALELLNRAGSLGVEVLQVADNLPLDALSPGEFDDFDALAQELGIALEVGTRGTAVARLEKYVSLAQRLGSPILRVVISDHEHSATADVVSALKPLRSLFTDAGVALAIENHERFSVEELVSIVEQLGHDWVGICLDTVNSFGALEGPAVVVHTLGPLAINLHVKDFVVRRQPHMMGFLIEGCAVGSGQLDVPWLVGQLGGKHVPLTAVIELWTPRSGTLEATIQTENTWAEQSVAYLKKFFAEPDF
jgi:sugar phosphate isomerase/epimerase